jgi:hypothetical protein
LEDPLGPEGTTHLGRCRWKGAWVGAQLSNWVFVGSLLGHDHVDDTPLQALGRLCECSP